MWKNIEHCNNIIVACQLLLLWCWGYRGPKFSSKLSSLIKKKLQTRQAGKNHWNPRKRSNKDEVAENWRNGELEYTEEECGIDCLQDVRSNVALRTNCKRNFLHNVPIPTNTVSGRVTHPHSWQIRFPSWQVSVIQFVTKTMKWERSEFIKS